MRTPFHGEKESCYQRLVLLLHQHNLVLFDLSPSLPRRLDVAVLRVQIGLAPAGGKGTASAKGSAGGGKPPGGQNARSGKGTGTTGGAGQQKPGGASAGKAPPGGSSRGSPKASSDPQVLLFQSLSEAERKRALQGPLFSRGLLEVIKRAGAYGRLVAEVQAFNKSGQGVAMSDRELTVWLERVLARQGSRVQVRQGLETVFDDIVAYCRFEYVAETQARRQAEERQAREQHAAAERKRREAEARQAKAKREAEERARQEEARRRAPPEPDDPLFDFEVTFDVLAEAQLYLKVVRRVLSDPSLVTSVARAGEFYVNFTATEADDSKIEERYQRALNDLELAAETIRLEAARVREEAIRRIEAEYTARCEEALRVAVKAYRA